MPYTDLQFIGINRRKQRWDKKSHRPIPFFTLCIRKKALQRLKGKHLLLVSDDIGEVALRQCKFQAKMNAARRGKDEIVHWGVTEVSSGDEDDNPKGVRGTLQEQATCTLQAARTAGSAEANSGCAESDHEQTE